MAGDVLVFDMRNAPLAFWGSHAMGGYARVWLARFISFYIAQLNLYRLTSIVYQSGSPVKWPLWCEVTRLTCRSEENGRRDMKAIGQGANLTHVQITSAGQNL